MSMDQQIVVVIGGSSGIGYEVARQTRAQGARLIIIGRHPARLFAAAERLDGESDALLERTRLARLIGQL